MLPHVLGRAEARPSIRLPDGPDNPTEYRGFEASRITSARLPARRTAIPPTAKLEIPELRLIV
jgi:hypothetical protein